MEELSELTNEEVVMLCANRMLGKHFDVDFDANRDVFVDFFKDYKNYVKYLNDFMGVVCKKFSTEMDEIYKYICDILDEEWDNESLFDFRIKRLLINTPQRVLSIANDDLRELNLEHMEEELDVILESKYYQENSKDYEVQLQTARQNIEIIKAELNEN